MSWRPVYWLAAAAILMALFMVVFERRQPAPARRLALDDAAFKSRFAGTPLLRPKRRGLLRNVCVALGNSGRREALPALECAARDAEPLIREHAEWAIRQIENDAK